MEMVVMFLTRESSLIMGNKVGSKYFIKYGKDEINVGKTQHI